MISGDLDPVEITRTVQEIMWEKVGIVRDGAGLTDAISEFEHMRDELIPRLAGDDLFAALEAANLCLTAEIVARAALYREESRATQVRTDYPTTDDSSWLKHVAVTRREKITLSTLPVIGVPSD